MSVRIKPSGWKRILNYLLAGAVFGVLYACSEYIIKLDTEDEQTFVPLLIRAPLAGACILTSVAVFERLFKHRFTGRRFVYLVLVRSCIYTLIITAWLVAANSAWYAIQGGAPVSEQLYAYFSGEMFFVNLASIMVAVLVVVGVGAINNLHRKGELVNFIMGRYHNPREVERIFCFIDLKDSTTIAERLGHLRFAMFLKEYYSDLSHAIRKTEAQVYQYVGDEIVLSWSFADGLGQNHCVHCFFLMQDTFARKTEHYLTTYGVTPRFRAGLHGGHVIVTWVGEVKKEIVYIGDVVNTAARIREDCKRLEKDFLISSDLLQRITLPENIRASFAEETIPRGKAKAVRLYSLERQEAAPA